MARGMHRHRRIRLDNLAATRISTRASNAPAKVKAAVRRDARVIAKIKATPDGVSLSPEVQSWLSRQVGKAFAKITAADIAAVIA